MTGADRLCLGAAAFCLAFVGTLLVSDQARRAVEASIFEVAE